MNSREMNIDRIIPLYVDGRIAIPSYIGRRGKCSECDFNTTPLCGMCTCTTLTLVSRSYVNYFIYKFLKRKS